MDKRLEKPPPPLKKSGLREWILELGAKILKSFFFEEGLWDITSSMTENTHTRVLTDPGGS